jgi:PDGLE domain
MPLYCPYPLAESIPGMLLPHLLVFGVIEASATAGVVAWSLRSGFSVEATARTGAGGRLLWGALALLCLLSPLGLLATGDAWGEWDPDKLKERVGFTPTGVGRLADSWHGALKDYTVPGWDEGTKQAVGYVISAVVGVLLVALVTFVVGRLLARRRRQNLPGPPLAREGSPVTAPSAPPASEIDGPKASS